MGEVVPPTCVETDGREMTMLKSEAGSGGGGEEAQHPLTKHKPQIAIKHDKDFFLAPPQDWLRQARARIVRNR
jgi:hypothetical protein